MKTHTGLSYHLVDLPAEGVRIAGTATAEELQIEPDDMFDFSEPFVYDLKLMPIGTSQSVYLQGKITTTLHGVCDRCNESADTIVEISDILHEYENALGKPLDLTDDIREDILTALPVRILCKEDCKGLCPYCGQNLNQEQCTCEPPVFDEEPDENEKNPWQKLDDLKF